MNILIDNFDDIIETTDSDFEKICSEPIGSQTIDSEKTKTKFSKKYHLKKVKDELAAHQTF